VKAHYEILDEVRDLVGREDKPDDVLVTSAAWSEARSEIKDLLMAVRRVEEEAKRVVKDAKVAEDWKLAYRMYDLWVRTPYLDNLDPILYREEVIRDRQQKYIVWAKEWRDEIKELCFDIRYTVVRPEFYDYLDQLDNIISEIV